MQLVKNTVEDTVARHGIIHPKRLQQVSLQFLHWKSCTIYDPSPMKCFISSKPHYLHEPESQVISEPAVLTSRVLSKVKGKFEAIEFKPCDS